MRTRRLTGGSAGQSLAEFALVLPVLLLLLLAIVDGGRAIFAFNQMSQATRNVARVASVTCFETDPRCDWTTNGTPLEVAVAEARAGAQGPVSWMIECIDPATLTLSSPDTYTTRSLDPSGSNTCQVGDTVRVQATMTFRLLFGPLAGDFGTVNVGSTSDQEILQ